MCEAAQLQELRASEASLRLEARLTSWATETPEELQEMDARQCGEASLRRGSPAPCVAFAFEGQEQLREVALQRSEQVARSVGQVGATGGAVGAARSYGRRSLRRPRNSMPPRSTGWRERVCRGMEA